MTEPSPPRPVPGPPRPGPAGRRRGAAGAAGRGPRGGATASPTSTSGRSPSTSRSSRPSTPGSSASSARSTSSDGPPQPARRRARAAGAGPLPRARGHAHRRGPGRRRRRRPPPSRPPASRPAPRSSSAPTPTQPSWVSRGAHKLLGALDAFPVAVEGRRALDAGASTGGFTEVLLSRGAAEVVAVDVGYGELAWSLRTDDRVRVHERTNVRTLTPEAIDGPVDLVVADLSFISLRLVLPALTACAARRTPTCCRWSSRSSRSAASGSAPGEWSATPSTGSQAVLEVGRAAASPRLGDRRGGGQSAARPGWQRGVLPVAAPRRRAAAGGRRPSSSARRGRSEPSRHRAREHGRTRPRRVLLTVHTGRRDIVELARTSAARLTAGGIVVRLLEDEAAGARHPRRRGRARRRRGRRATPRSSWSSAATARSCAPPSWPATPTPRSWASTSAGSASSPRPSPRRSRRRCTAIERCEYSVEERLALAGRRPRRRRHRRRRHLGAQRGVGREGRALPGARRRPRHRRPAADQLRLRRRPVRHPHRLHRLRLLRRRPGRLARRRGAAAGPEQRARAVRPPAGHLAELGAHRRGAGRRQPGAGVGRRAPHGRDPRRRPGRRPPGRPAGADRPGARRRPSATGWSPSSACRCAASATPGTTPGPATSCSPAATSWAATSSPADGQRCPPRGRCSGAGTDDDA